MWIIHVKSHLLMGGLALIFVTSCSWFPRNLHVYNSFICRMLLAFSEQTKGQKLPENASDQEMLEIVMSRWDLLLVLIGAKYDWFIRWGFAKRQLLNNNKQMICGGYYVCCLKVHPPFLFTIFLFSKQCVERDANMDCKPSPYGSNLEKQER